jgi:hypothetical protein
MFEFLPEIPKQLVDYGWLASAVGAVIVFAVKTASDRRDAAQKRFDKFVVMRTRYDTDPAIQATLGFINQNETKVASPEDNTAYKAFVEEVALLVQSKLMSVEVAFYYFGSDLIRAYLLPSWVNESPPDPFWGLFRSFARRLHKIAVAYPEVITIKALPPLPPETTTSILPVERYRF